MGKHGQAWEAALATQVEVENRLSPPSPKKLRQNHQ
jgi:hypothetical protein